MEAIKLSRVLLLTTVFFTTISISGAIFAHLSAQAQNPKTEIIIDESKNTIHFVIDGQDIAVMTSEGLHVYESISYNGTITDGTPEWLKKENKSKQ